MFDWIRSRLLAVLRVPPEPAAPWGAPGSVRVFRAGRNYYRLRLLVWAAGQLATLVGIVISLGFLAKLKHDVDYYRTPSAPAVQASEPAPSDEAAVHPTPPGSATPRPAGPRVRTELPPELQHHARKIAQQTPWWLFPAIGLFEVGGILLYLAQLPVTYAVLRLDFEQRWYIVTDRSLRIRSGLVKVQEATMSFANVQQVTLTEGPLQRLLRIADVRVRSAGGGDGEEHNEGQRDSMHVGIFHGVENALAIRDLILERLRQFRAAGLGDPDDARDAAANEVPAAAPSVNDPTVLGAARAALVEARLLHAACTAQPAPREAAS